MDVAISGASGLIGTALSRSLTGDGHRVRPLVRGAASGPLAIAWDPERGTVDSAGLEGVDAVVHLAGAAVAPKRWTPARKQLVLRSRTAGTTTIAKALAALERPPAVFVSASAQGFYGDCGEEEVTEAHGPGDDFLADVCKAWEAATEPAQAAGIRVAHLRTGIVLSADGGALGTQLLAFKLGLGAQSGDGSSWMSWITLDDEVRAIRHLIDHEVHGPANLAAPNPVRNGEFTKAVAKELHRPAFLRVPRFVRRAPGGLGPMLESLLFTSIKLAPSVLLDSGFAFHHPDLVGAVHSVLGRSDELA